MLCRACAGSTCHATAFSHTPRALEDTHAASPTFFQGRCKRGRTDVSPCASSRPGSSETGHPSSRKSCEVNLRMLWPNGVCACAASSMRPISASAERLLPPSATRALELRATFISMRNAVSPGHPRWPTRFTTQVMRVRGIPNLPIIAMSRCMDSALPTAPSPTTRQRSHEETIAATASVHVVEVSTITTSASARSTPSKSSSGLPKSSARSGTPRRSPQCQSRRNAHRCPHDVRLRKLTRHRRLENGAYIARFLHTEHRVGVSEHKIKIEQSGSQSRTSREACHRRRNRRFARTPAARGDAYHGSPSFLCSSPHAALQLVPRAAAPVPARRDLPLPRSPTPRLAWVPPEPRHPPYMRYDHYARPLPAARPNCAEARSPSEDRWCLRVKAPVPNGIVSRSPCCDATAPRHTRTSSRGITSTAPA